MEMHSRAGHHVIATHLTPAGRERHHVETFEAKVHGERLVVHLSSRLPPGWVAWVTPHYDAPEPGWRDFDLRVLVERPSGGERDGQAI